MAGNDAKTRREEAYPLDRRSTAALGGRRLELRILSAWEALEAGREARRLAQDGREQALCANACLLARALEQNGTPLFASGEEVLQRLSVAQIAALAKQWAKFSREENPSPLDQKAVERLKKAWSTRLTRAFSGVCSRRSGRCPPRPGPEK